MAGGDRESGERSVRRINLPTVDIAIFSFKKSPGGVGGISDIGKALKVSVEPDMPLSEVSLWNTEKLVGLTVVKFELLCLAKCSKSVRGLHLLQEFCAADQGRGWEVR